MKKILIALTVSLLFGYSGLQAFFSLFDAPIDYRVGNNPSHLTVADFNQDNFPDIAVSNWGDRSVSVLLNRGDGTFGSEMHYRVGSFPRSIFSSDFDGDGYGDIATANWGTGDVSVLLNRGDGTFQDAVDYHVGVGLSYIRGGDLDGDGDVDLVVTSWGEDLVLVLINGGDGTFSVSASYQVGSYPSSLYCADLDQDGDSDIAVSNWGSQNVSILKNMGDGTFRKIVDIEVGLYPSALCGGDFDRDGFVDLAVACYLDGEVWVLKNDGNGGFVTGSSYEAVDGAISVAGSDVNGDLNIDLVVVGESSHGIGILMGKGDGTFGDVKSYSVGGLLNGVGVGDFDGDGILDLAVADFNGSDIFILSNKGSGEYPGADSYHLSVFAPLVFGGDLDGDGDVDLFSAFADSFGGYLGVLRNEEGTFSKDSVYSVRYHWWPWGIWGADFDNDRDEDIVVGGRSWGFHAPDLFIFWNSGDGSFNKVDSFWIFDTLLGTPHVSGIFCADFNSDGNIDMALSPRFAWATMSTWKVAIIFNNGDGTFEEPVFYDIGCGPKSIYGADFDNDGDIDLVLPDTCNNYISLLFNNGDGTFSDTVNISTSYRPSSVYSSDLDNDGDMDLLVAFREGSAGYGDKIAVLRNYGGGEFANPTYYSVGLEPSAIFCADFNKDSSVDIGVTGFHSSSVSILLNRGDGTFGEVVNYGTGGVGPCSIYGADFDGDGDVDLAFGNQESGDVTVIFNRAVPYGVGERHPYDVYRGSLSIEPNPASRIVRLIFPVNEGGDVFLEVYDITGRRVSEVDLGRFLPGVQRVLWSGEGYHKKPLSSGVYFLVLREGKRVYRGRVLLLKR